MRGTSAGKGSIRPTHQLFFSAPAVYLVVWNPREGTSQGFVNEWISIIKYREPEREDPGGGHARGAWAAPPGH